MANPFVHIELTSADLEESKRFYGSLFDWKLEPAPASHGMDYTIIKVGEGTGGGMIQHQMLGMPSVWVPYVQVDDIRDRTAKATSLGARIIRDVEEIPGNGGSFSIVQDPTGAVFGLYEPRPT
ncbi:MAG TPA: VOC family protein [Micropepsaceae bacterium]|nr:VOC family protein [Micropepsaceae bacterium]